MILPRQVMSALMPNRSCAPPKAIRNPVMISSKIRMIPRFSVSSRMVSRKPATGGIMPMLPATGSTITQAMSSPRSDKVLRTASISLYGRLIVSFARSAGTPGLSGIPKVAAPDPA